MTRTEPTKTQKPKKTLKGKAKALRVRTGVKAGAKALKAYATSYLVA